MAKKFGLSIYGRAKSKSEKGNTTLALVANSKRGGVSVVAVDDKGAIMKNGWLVTFCGDGKIYRHKKVDKALGFALKNKSAVLMKKL